MPAKQNALTWGKTTHTHTHKKNFVLFFYPPPPIIEMVYASEFPWPQRLSIGVWPRFKGKSKSPPSVPNLTQTRRTKCCSSTRINWRQVCLVCFQQHFSFFFKNMFFFIIHFNHGGNVFLELWFFCFFAGGWMHWWIQQSFSFDFVPFWKSFLWMNVCWIGWRCV